MPWSTLGLSYQHAQLGLTDKCFAINELEISNRLDVSALGPSKKGMTLNCYQSSPRVKQGLQLKYDTKKFPIYN